MEPRLGSCPRPALFLVGENEKIYSPTAAVKRLRRVAPLVQAEILPGVGHDLTFVRPDLVTARVLRFLDETAPQRSTEPDPLAGSSLAAS